MIARLVAVIAISTRARSVDSQMTDGRWQCRRPQMQAIPRGVAGSSPSQVGLAGTANCWGEQLEGKGCRGKVALELTMNGAPPGTPYNNNCCEYGAMVSQNAGYSYGTQSFLWIINSNILPGLV